MGKLSKTRVRFPPPPPNKKPLFMGGVFIFKVVKFDHFIFL
jgi:hypothetical protein